jgi:hypothetical protein
LTFAEEDGEDNLPQSIEVTEDALALRIPLGRDDADNYVIGAQPVSMLGCHSAPHTHHLDSIAS